YVDAQTGTKNVLVEREDGRDRLTKLEYDAAYRLCTVYRPGFTGGTAHKTTVTYDAASRPSTLVDGNGNKVVQTYDAVGRLESRYLKPPVQGGVSLLATKESFEHDDLGRLTAMVTYQGTSHDILMSRSELQYDSLNRLL